MADAGGAKDPGETARYIEAMALELRTLASTKRLDFLAYLLAMVEREAAAEAQKQGAPAET